ncbi:MAG: GntG family PLP-dependent aldolase [Bacteroidota bacterium]
MIDLRSDTVTKPTPAMREAMATAEVGDDVFGEDPTGARLEARIAALLDKEAAVFVPSGVMGNQIALHLHTRPADEVIVAERGHIYHYESGAPAALSGVQLKPVGDARGYVTPDDVTAAVRGTYDWEPRTTLLCLENTVNKAGGRVFPLDLLRATAQTAREHDLALHLDGARLWNAVAATGIAAAAWAAPFDTVNVCLSKGLGAPVGSVLAGSAATMREARRIRKRLGGGMRQIGLLAAAGLHALDHHLGDLALDHARALRLAETVAALPSFDIDLATAETNIVLFDTVPCDAATVLAKLEARDVHMVAFGPRTIRATFHRDLSDADVDLACDALQAVDRALAA